MSVEGYGTHIETMHNHGALPWPLYYKANLDEFAIDSISHWQRWHKSSILLMIKPHDHPGMRKS